MVLTRRAFARGAFEELPSLRLLRRAAISLLVAHAVLGLWSGYRAIVQVFSLELVAPDGVLRPGTPLGYDVVSSGRVAVTVRLTITPGGARRDADGGPGAWSRHRRLRSAHASRRAIAIGDRDAALEIRAGTGARSVDGHWPSAVVSDASADDS